MSQYDPRDADLQRAFQALGETAPGPCSAEDLELVWRATAGELPPEQRRALIDRMATDEALAEAWRVAAALQDGPARDTPVGPARPMWARPWMLAVAAGLVAATATVIYQRDVRPPDDTYRAPAAAAVTSLIPDGSLLPRDDFRLQWSPGPEGSRYDVRVTTEELDLVAAATADQPEVLIPADRFGGMPPGTPLFWQVEVVWPSGERRTSATFTVRVE